MTAGFKQAAWTIGVAASCVAGGVGLGAIASQWEGEDAPPPVVVEYDGDRWDGYVIEREPEVVVPDTLPPFIEFGIETCRYIPPSAPLYEMNMCDYFLGFDQ